MEALYFGVAVVNSMGMVEISASPVRILAAILPVVMALRCHGLPFEVKVDEPNATTYAAMEAADKGEDMFGPFDSVGDLMEALNA